MRAAFDADDDAFAIDRIDDAGALADDNRARVARRDALHARAHIGRFGAQQRHRLALHVRTHQRAVRVVVLKERNQAGGDRDQLFRADVHVFDFVAMLQNEVAGLPSIHQDRRRCGRFVDGDVGLGDDVLVFFPSRQVVAMGFELGLLFVGRERVDWPCRFRSRGPPVRLCNAVSPGIQDLDFVHHSAFFHAAVGTLDKAVFVDARKAGERRDQADVRTFRRFNRADAAVVRRVNVANFEARAFAGQTARSKRRETPLVRDLRERIGLIHELRELARSEELADGGHHRLRIHQVMRHGRRHFLVDRHLFFDRALHAHQADAELVFEQFADRANAAVAQVIDVVDSANTPAQLQQIEDRVDEVLLIERPLVERPWRSALS